MFDSRLWGSRAKYQFYSSVWLVEALWGSGLLSAGPETTDVAGFFAEHDLPWRNWRRVHLRQVPMAFKLARGDLPVPYFDPTT